MWEGVGVPLFGTQHGAGPLTSEASGAPPTPWPTPSYNLWLMADTAQSEPVAPRLAAVREQLSLLSDYL